MASPVLSMSAMILKGNYEGYIDLRGMRPEALEEQNIPLIEGSRLPETKTSNLELIIGNLIPEMLYEKIQEKDIGKPETARNRLHEGFFVLNLRFGCIFGFQTEWNKFFGTVTWQE